MGTFFESARARVRVWLSTSLVCLIIVAMSTLAPAHASAPAIGSGFGILGVDSYVVLTDFGVPYVPGGTRFQVMDAFTIEGAGPFPAMVYIHAGAWTGGSREAYWDRALGNARLGIAGFCIDYQLGTEESPAWPGAIQDVVLAIRHIKEHAAEYRIDPDRIVLFGDSAGGHLAALAASLRGDEPFIFSHDGPCEPARGAHSVAMVIDYFGPTDLGLIGDRGDRPAYPYTEVSVMLLGVPYSGPLGRPDLWAAASPAAYVRPDLPPVFIAHGSKDRIISKKISRSYAEALAQAGATVMLVEVEDAGHGFTPEQEALVRIELMPMLSQVLGE